MPAEFQMLGRVAQRLVAREDGDRGLHTAPAAHDCGVEGRSGKLKRGEWV
jgi:hypothetical protein